MAMFFPLEEFRRQKNNISNTFHSLSDCLGKASFLQEFLGNHLDILNEDLGKIKKSTILFRVLGEKEVSIVKAFIEIFEKWYDKNQEKFNLDTLSTPLPENLELSKTFFNENRNQLCQVIAILKEAPAKLEVFNKSAFILSRSRIVLSGLMCDSSSVEKDKELKEKYRKIQVSPALCALFNNLDKEAKESLSDDERTITTLDMSVRSRRDKCFEPVLQNLCAVFDKGIYFAEKAYANNMDKRYLDAAVAVLEIVEELDHLCSLYYSNQIKLEKFKEKIKVFFRKETKDPRIEVLNSHRGAKKIVVNILMNILSLFYRAYKGKWFTPETDSARQLRNLEEALMKTGEDNTTNTLKV